MGNLRLVMENFNAIRCLFYMLNWICNAVPARQSDSHHACFSYRLPQTNATPQHRRQIRRAVEREQADEPDDDQHWYGGEEDFGPAEEGEGLKIERQQK